MTVTIYSHQCTTCGVGAHLIRRVLRAHPEAAVIDTRYERDQVDNHVAALKLAGIEVDSYPAVVVDGEKVTRLEEWKP